jgi:aspartate carbamoyltransferase catalytic subunit
VILDQVSAGLAVRMSVLYHLLAGEAATGTTTEGDVA